MTSRKYWGRVNKSDISFLLQFLLSLQDIGLCADSALHVEIHGVSPGQGSAVFCTSVMLIQADEAPYQDSDVESTNGGLQHSK